MKRCDVAIIGAGPCGLFQAFELGLLGISSVVFDALPEPGGQCVRLYPDKPIYDIPACPQISARGLIDNLLQQLAPFKPMFRLQQKVSQLVPHPEGGIQLQTSQGDTWLAQAVVIASGAGAFEPVRLLVPGVERHEGGQLRYAVPDPEHYRGKQLVVVGGGDSALDWALNLIPVAASVSLVHRSERLRAQPHSVQAMQQACERLEMQFLTGRIAGLIEQGDQLSGVKVQSSDGVTRRLDADALLVLFGLAPQIRELREWGLSLQQNLIEVDTARFETSVPGIYAVGDINTYPGKQKLILSGFHEAALVAFAIKAQLNPGQPVALQYTTTSPVLHQRLGVKPDIDDLLDG